MFTLYIEHSLVKYQIGSGSLDETLAYCHLFEPGPARAEEAGDDEKWKKSDQGGGEATQPPVVLFNWSFERISQNYWSPGGPNITCRSDHTLK